MTTIERIRQALRTARRDDIFPGTIKVSGATFDAYCEEMDRLGARTGRGSSLYDLRCYCGIPLVKDDALGAESIVVMPL